MKYKVLYESSTIQKVLETQEFIFAMEDAAKLWAYMMIERGINLFKTLDLRYIIRVDKEYTWLESNQMSIMVGIWEVAEDYNVDTTSFV